MVLVKTVSYMIRFTAMFHPDRNSLAIVWLITFALVAGLIIYRGAWAVWAWMGS